MKELVIRNSDYVIDSLCRQLRHLPHYPYAPSLLAAILRHTGAAPHLLPLLEEPVREFCNLIPKPVKPHAQALCLLVIANCCKIYYNMLFDFVILGSSLS